MTATISQGRALANAVSDSVGPFPAVLAFYLAARHDQRSWFSSVGWTGLAITLLAVLPYLVTLRLRHPADGSRPEHGRKGAYMALVAGLSLAGLLVLTLLPSPSAVVDVGVAIVVTLVAVAAATGLAGWSNHAAACAGGVTMCVVLGGPAWWALTLAVVAVGWARLALGRHNLAQVVLGAAWGGGVAALTLWQLL